MDWAYVGNEIEARVEPENVCAWRGQSLLVLQCTGTIDADGHTGYYFRGARHLRRLTFLVNGAVPHLCSVARVGTNRIEVASIYPEVASGGTGGTGSGMLHRRQGILERGLDLRLTYAMRPAGIDVALVVTNRWDASAEFEVSWAFDADFESLDNARNGVHDVHVPVACISTDNGMELRREYPGFTLGTKLHMSDERSWTVDDGRLSAVFRLGRGEQAHATLRIRALDPNDSIDEQGMVRRERRLSDWYSGLCRMSTPEQGPMTLAVRTALDDIGGATLLDGAANEWLAPAAGYPHYPHLFGRDALTAGWMSAMFDRGEAVEHTLNKLGRLQGAITDTRRDEEPGRIVQQSRADPPARLGAVPFDRYYGDFAAPLMYVIALAHLYSWSGDREHVRRHWDTCRRILRWACVYGDSDGDGFLEYCTHSEAGPRNQGWKDSENAVVDDGGELVEPPIASCEVQGYYYAALQAAAFFSTLLGAPHDGLDYLKRAHRLKRDFNRCFWVADGGYVAFGLDARKRQIRSRTSNMGHCLASGIVERDRIGSVVQTLFAPDMFSGWGIRTLSAAHPAFNPLSYHLGSVWSVENATIAFGLRRYGLGRETMILTKAIIDLAGLWPGGRIPECVGGYDRREYAHPGAYPRATSTQTWNAAAACLLVHVMLGLQPVAPLGLLFVDPILPPWLPDVTLENLRLGGASVNLRFRRARDGVTHTEVLRKQGRIRLMSQPPVNSLSASPWRRLTALVSGL